jgi:hypothetical protein
MRYNRKAMNEIKVIVETIVNYDGEEFLDLGIVVDETLLNDKYCVNYGALIGSVRGNGEYFILTCTCGIPECAGIYKGVEVKFINNFVEWHFIDPYPLRDKTFVFDGNSYVKAIRFGFEDVRNILKNALLKGKKFCIYPPDIKLYSQEEKFLFNLLGADETVFLNSNWRKTKRYSRTSFRRIRKLLKKLLVENP